MTNYSLTIVIALVFAASLFSVNAGRCNKADRAALLAFKDSFPDNKYDSFYYSNSEWMANSTKDCCNWNNVLCDDSTGRVVSLSFSGNSFDPPDMDLNGTIPAVLGNLTMLTQIYFDHMPSLVGPIPPQILQLKKLKILAITHCQISGSVPSFLSQLPSLQRLNLGYNMLSGTVPPSLANLPNLSSLALNDNRLTGKIPPSLFSKLSKPSSVYLDLSNNNMKGRIPQSLANVDFLACYLDNNKFTGDASPLFGRNKTIHSVSMNSNNFKFDLSNVEYPLALTYLDISRNEIYGSISNQITEVPRLLTAVFSHNNLCRKIPSGGHFPSFPAVYFEHNKCLCGTPLKPCK